jgi:proline dehydrogenase
VRTHASHYRFPVHARPRPGPLRGLRRRYAAGPDGRDALAVAAEVAAEGRDVALERLPAADADELLLLADRIGDGGLGARVELTVSLDVLGAAAAGSVLRAALDAGVGVAVEGTAVPVDTLADRFPAVRIVVPAGEPGAEERCRLFAGRPVRLVQPARLAGRTAELAFVRCLNVLMSGEGRPAIAATDPRLIAIAGERAAWNDRPPESWEHVMPYGVRTDEQRRLTAGGYRVRVAVPWGPAAAAAPLRRLVGRP